MKLSRLLIPMAASLLIHVAVFAAVRAGLRVEPSALPMLEVTLLAPAGAGDVPGEAAVAKGDAGQTAVEVSPVPVHSAAPDKAMPVPNRPQLRVEAAEAGASVHPPPKHLRARAADAVANAHADEPAGGSGRKGSETGPPASEPGSGGAGDKPNSESAGPRSEARFRIGSLDNPAPSYPAASRRLGEEGRVVLKVRVSEQGRAEEVQIEQSSTFERLDQAAVQTVKRWRFMPARQGNQAVAGWARVPIRFRLDDE